MSIRAYGGAVTCCRRKSLFMGRNTATPALVPSDALPRRGVVRRDSSFPYVFLDGSWLKRSWGGELKNVAVLVAIGVGKDGHREILGVCEGTKEDKESWRGFLRHLKQRGLQGVQLITSDKSLGLVESIPEFYPEAAWQRCMVHWQRNVLSEVPRGKSREVAAMLKAIHAQEDKVAAMAKGRDVVEKLRAMKLAKAADLVQESLEETLRYMKFPEEHWRRIRTNNPLERIMKLAQRRCARC